LPDPGVVGEIKVDTPVAHFWAKDIRVSDLLILGLTAVMAVQLYILLAHKADAKEASDQHVKAIRAQTVALCILSLPMERREKELTDQNGLCRTLVQLP